MRAFPASTLAVVAATHEEMRRATAGLTMPLLQCVTGPGPTRAADAVRKLLGEQRVDRMALVGFAGGLDPRFKVADVVTPRTVIDDGGRTTQLFTGVQGQTILTVSHIVASPEDKRRLFEQRRAAAVDMESFAVAQVAAERRVPLTVIRAISDPADEALPAESLHWITDDGQIDTGAVTRYLATHPWRLPAMLKLKANADAAGEALAAALAEWATQTTILIYGGALDPPHNAHVRLPELVRQALGADVIYYIPAARPPLKSSPVDASADDRVAMLRLALRDQPRAQVLTDELDRAGDGRPSYTVDTLEGLRQRLGPHVRMRLLIGADQARQFEQWRDWRRVVELAEPVVMLRPPDTRESLSAEWRDRVVEVPVMDVSSTEIRRRVAAGESIDQWVPPAVLDYIRDRGLYKR